MLFPSKHIYHFLKRDISTHQVWLSEFHEYESRVPRSRTAKIEVAN